MARSISETTKILHQNPYHNMVTIKVIELKRPYWQSAKNLLGTYLLISKMTKSTKNLLTVWWQLRSLNFERLSDANLLKIYLVFDAILTTLRWQKKINLEYKIMKMQNRSQIQLSKFSIALWQSHCNTFDRHHVAQVHNDLFLKI